jgi:hypothetical protein
MRDRPHEITSIGRIETGRRYRRTRYRVSTFHNDLWFVHHRADLVLALFARRCPRARVG